MPSEKTDGMSLCQISFITKTARAYLSISLHDEMAEVRSALKMINEVESEGDEDIRTWTEISSEPLAFHHRKWEGRERRFFR